MELETYLHSHILGGLYGLALGDAWAMPAFLRPNQTWDYYNGWLEELTPGPPDHPVHANFKMGQVTGSTQQAMAMAQAIIDDGKVTVEGTARVIVTWYNQVASDEVHFIGSSTRRAVTALKSGLDPQLTGLYGDTNGCVGRVSPVGLIHPDMPEATIHDAALVCTPTHFTDVAISGAGAVAAAIAQAMIPNTTLADIIDTAVWGADIGLQHGTPWFGASIARKIDYAVQLANDFNLPERERIQNLYDLVGSTMAVADSVPCAFGILAIANGNPTDTATYAAALSGDASTVGAIACAIAGTWHGIDAIPLEYIEILRQANPQYNFEETAEGLYEVALQNYSNASRTGETLLEDILDQGK